MSELPLEVHEYLSWLVSEKGRSANTVSAYRRDLAAYCTWLGGRTLADVDPATIESYVGALRAAGKAPSSVARALVAVRSLHRFLAEEGDLAVDPGSAVEAPRVPRGLPKALSEDEVGTLLDAVVGSEPTARRDRAILEVLYGTGVRISELVGLSLGDLDLDGALVRLFGKRSKERIVPIGRPAIGALARWLDQGRPELAPPTWRRREDADAVFLGVRGARLNRQGTWQVLQRWATVAGLDAHISPHVLRHSCATHLLDNGADIRTVQEFLGHASVSTTQIYTRVATDRLWQAYRDAHPRSGPRP